MVEPHPLRAVDSGTFMADNDVGKMFLNFMTDIRMHPYAGVDLTTLFPEELLSDDLTLHARWDWLFMGFRPSLYLTTRNMIRLEP